MKNETHTFWTGWLLGVIVGILLGFDLVMLLTGQPL
jgi:uncharacterized membrane-anchored protein YhcB (DUF1043 family)